MHAPIIKFKGTRHSNGILPTNQDTRRSASCKLLHCICLAILYCHIDASWNCMDWPNLQPSNEMCMVSAFLYQVYSKYSRPRKALTTFAFMYICWVSCHICTCMQFLHCALPQQLCMQHEGGNMVACDGSDERGSMTIA